MEESAPHTHVPFVVSQPEEEIAEYKLRLLKFERPCSSTGPFGGKVILRVADVLIYNNAGALIDQAKHFCASGDARLDPQRQRWRIFKYAILAFRRLRAVSNILVYLESQTHLLVHNLHFTINILRVCALHHQIIGEIDKWGACNTG